MDKKTKARIIYDHEINELSYRSLGKKYGIVHTTIYNMINSRGKHQEKAKETEPVETSGSVEEAALPEDIKTLKEALRKAHLKIELQDLMIDISSKELGIDLRKKHGTRQSK
jgi:hypothetical protein